jgi:transposase
MLYAELGSLKSKQIAKLAGLAPINCDGGKKHGKRFVQGGAQIRKALYMSIVTAKKFNQHIKPFFSRLENEYEKPYKIVATAAMRKSLLLANALVRDGRAFSE